MQWFDVDKAGLARLLERKGKEFALGAPATTTS